MTYDFDTYIDRRGTHAGKMLTFLPPEIQSQNNSEYEDYMYFTSADMDFRCSDAIRQAIQKVTDFNLYGYTLVSDENGQDYYDAVKTWLKKSRGWEVNNRNIFMTPGALAGISNALDAFTQPGDGVIINKPVYTRFDITITGAGREVINSPLIADNNGYYTIDFEDFEKKASDPHNTAYLMCSPHNPVGRVWTEDELLKIYEICQRNNVLIISDEVHSDLVRKDIAFKSIAQVADGIGVVVCTGYGKTFNLAALEPCYMVITDENLLSSFDEGKYISLTTPFSVAAVKAASYDSDDWLGQVNDYIDGNIDAALEFIQKNMPKAKCRRPEGTYILWIDLRGYGLDDEEIHDRIYNKAKVILEDGTAFDPEGGSGFQRMCIPTSRSHMLEALKRIENVLK